MIKRCIYIFRSRFKENTLFLCEMDRRKKKKKEISRTHPMEDIEGIVVHGSPCLPHPVRMWEYRMDTKVTRQGARGKTMVLDEHRFPSGPSSNSPSGARTGACRAPWGYTAPQPPSTEGRSILWCTRFLKQKCIFLVYSQPPCASDTSIVVSILSRHERRRGEEAGAPFVRARSLARVYIRKDAHTRMWKFRSE